MALSAIVKKIYTFANILSQAGTDAVQDWNDKSLQNALNWAKYCTKIAEQTKDSAFRHELDLQVQSFTCLLKPSSLLYLDMNTLYDARETLCKRILQNPHSPDNIVTKVSELEMENMVQFLQKRKQNKEMYSLCQPLYLFVGEDNNFDMSPVRVKATYVLDRLLHISGLNIISENRLNKFLEQVTIRIMGCNHGLEVLCAILLTEVKCLSQHSNIEEIKNQILRGILGINGNHSGVWTIDTEVLCDLSARDDLFLDHHIQYILSWLNDMEPVYGLTGQGELYTWSCSYRCEAGTSYSCLVEHVRKFTNYNKRLRLKLIPQLENLANKSYFNVFKDLLKCLQDG